MRRERSTLVFLGLFVAYFSLLTIPPAFAYLDPGSGSMILQMVAGVALGAAFAVKVFWRRIVGFFKRTPKDSAPKGP